MRAETRVRKFRLRRGRDHLPKCPLIKAEVRALAVWHAECERGIEHTFSWDAQMKVLERRYDQWARECEAARRKNIPSNEA